MANYQNADSMMTELEKNHFATFIVTTDSGKNHKWIDQEVAHVPPAHVPSARTVTCPPVCKGKWESWSSCVLASRGTHVGTRHSLSPWPTYKLVNHPRNRKTIFLLNQRIVN